MSDAYWIGLCNGISIGIFLMVATTLVIDFLSDRRRQR